MKWISSEKSPPLYVWPKDTWFNESDRQIYKADVDEKIWIGKDRKIPFPPKKCKIFND